MDRPHRWMGGALVLTVASLLMFAVGAPAGAEPGTSSRKARPPKPTPTPINVGLLPGSVSPAVITGGDGAVQTIKLSTPAPPGGTDVSITASDVIYTVSAGSTVHVPAGATSVSFPFRLSAPSTDTVRSLWAQVFGSELTKVAEITVLAADPSTRAVTSLRFSPDTAAAGTSTTGTVTLNNPAPTGGISVSLCSNTSYGPNVYIPQYVVVEAGQTTATFSAYVNSADAISTVTPSADLGTSHVTATLVVMPAGS